MRVVKSKNFSPVLDSILFGGSSVAMNLIELSRKSEPAKRLFAAQGLNNAILFKYPNFPEQMPTGASRNWGGGEAEEEDFRPIETGIYVPYDADHPRAGGSAIYLRQKNYETLLQEYLGLATEVEREDLRRDVKILDLLDTVPSLDPFLVKDCLDANRISFDPEYLQLDPLEVRRIRQAISIKITEIIEKAFSAGNRTVKDKERLVESLWDPSLPEARDFITAFGIAHDDAPLVFGAWKGITFYQVQLQMLAPKVADVLRWISSKDAVPFDAAINRAFLEQLGMYKDRIVKKLSATADETRTIMKSYEACHVEFLAGKPKNLVAFLKSARRTYWILARCISALNSTANIFTTDVKPSRGNRLSFEEETNMFQRLDVVLSRKREAPTSF
ncbi:MAG TPA: hypothetical protein VGE72_30275 [Azospirillum sp.]